LNNNIPFNIYIYILKNIWILNYYIKNWTDSLTLEIPNSARNFKQNELIFYTGPNTTPPDHFPFHYSIWKEMFWWHQDGVGIDIPVLTISADGIDNKGLAAIVKVRLIIVGHYRGEGADSDIVQLLKMVNNDTNIYLYIYINDIVIKQMAWEWCFT
jgi:hypothetical protein